MGKSSQCPHMKMPTSIWVAIICLGFVSQFGCGRSEITHSRAAEMFDKAGVVDKVNQEAKTIFDRFGTNESKNVYGSELTNFPAISSLGETVFFQNKNNPPGWSAHIEIPF